MANDYNFSSDLIQGPTQDGGNLTPNDYTYTSDEIQGPQQTQGANPPINVYEQAQALGLGLVEPLTGVSQGTGAPSSSGLDLSKILSSVSPDTWAKLAGGLIAGVGNAYVQGKKLEIEQQNANIARQAVDLKATQDTRAATSASGLSWNGLINSNQTKPLKPGQPLTPAQPRVQQ